MDTESAHRESFIIRVCWKPGQGAPEVWAHHVASGASVVLHDLKDVMAFVERWAPKVAQGRQGLK
ncbi:MAG: hypothetical protein MUQ10_09655 [Anaerolineae bacterium]|nr:hypothetical protein [Anaerolineae bacterium]